MSLQQCHCGWSKVTTYQGLRIHQGKMGCTAKGQKAEEYGQPYVGGLADYQKDFDLDVYTPIKNADYYSDMSLQECHCGWSKVTTYQGLRIHQGKMGCTPKGVRIPKEEQSFWKNRYGEVDQWEHQPEKTATVKKQREPLSPRPNSYTTAPEIMRKIKLENKPLAAPPRRSSQTETIPKSIRQLQDSSTGVQVHRLVRERPTVPPRPEVVRPREKDRRAQTLPEMREQKVAQARSSVKARKGNLEAEWLEISSVFSEVVRVAEDAERKSLNRSFSKLRTTTSTMMEEIQQKLEKLAAIVDVELDPTTAYKCLVSADGKRLSSRGGNQRFGSVLGFNRMTSGKSYWEVVVSNKTGWSLGVATGDAQREGQLLMCPDNGYWVAEHYKNKFAAQTNPPVGLRLKEKPQKVGVFVDYEEGLVSFYDATAQSHIYSFTECAFTEGIYPYFIVHVNEDGRADPLIISTVKRHERVEDEQRRRETDHSEPEERPRQTARDKLNTPDMSFQTCHCGWSKVTTYHGLRTHQGKKGCSPMGMSIPESEQFRFSSYHPQLTYQGPPIKVEEPVMNIFIPPFKSGSQQNTWMNQNDSGQFDWTVPVRTENVPVSPYLTNTAFPGTEDEMIEMVKAAMLNSDPRSFPTVMGSQILDGTNRALDSASVAQPSLRPMSQIFSTQVNPAAAEVPGKETNRSAFQTPPHYSTTPQTMGNARRALDFATSAQQVGQQVFYLPTTTAQETVRAKEREQEKEKEREKEKEDQKLQKTRQDRMRADLQQKIQTREQKMAEVRSSVKACKGGLDAEWLEINNVFSEVMRVVEDTRQKALQPLEKRRKRVKREAQDLVQKLQKEIDKLKMTIDELDKTPDLQVSPQTGLGETCDWKNVTVDTLFSFGTLRTITSNMMEEIHKELDKLSSVELKRIPTFAVDVKLDPTTAHPCLVLSPDGKMVSDGGKTQKVPDAPQRFDVFGSILGLNRLSSGKSYWEVEVGNKTGWDLGVARRDAKRKGKLSLSPDIGYWAIVHYDEEKYAALTAPPASLSLTGKPQKVGVFVDYEEGLVSFYHVTARSHIYSFTECSFSDEVFPYFSPHLKQNEKNTRPLIISAVKQQQ
ncbi:uncharacterized protein PEZ65_021965 [Lycodopsis pacificus]